MVKQSKKDKEDLASVTVPVFVDNVVEGMTRLSFMVIDYDDDQVNWNKELEERKIPYITLGPYCVVFKPFGKNEKFYSMNAIKDFIDEVEKETFLIESNHIWMPNTLLSKNPKRGEVYRVNIPLLMRGYQYANNRISENDFLKFCQRNKKLIKFDRQETDAFYSWQEDRISIAKTKHDKLLKKSPKKYQELYLDWKK
jgi:hypothetical protein